MYVLYSRLLQIVRWGMHDRVVLAAAIRANPHCSTLLAQTCLKPCSNVVKV